MKPNNQTTQQNPQAVNDGACDSTDPMRCFASLSPATYEGIIKARADHADSIEIVNGDTCDLDLLVEALKGQAKHGVLGSALRYLYLDETESGTALFMAERRDAMGWLEEYKAVYWFVTGWMDAEFYTGKDGTK